MPYPVMIGVTKDGSTLVGAFRVRYHESEGDLAVSERVYPSQIKHRCAVKRAGSWVIVCPSEVQAGEKPRPFKTDERRS